MSWFLSPVSSPASSPASSRSVQSFLQIKRSKSLGAQEPGLQKVSPLLFTVAAPFELMNFARGAAGEAAHFRRLSPANANQFELFCSKSCCVSCRWSLLSFPLDPNDDDDDNNELQYFLLSVCFRLGRRPCVEWWACRLASQPASQADHFKVGGAAQVALFLRWPPFEGFTFITFIYFSPELIRLDSLAPQTTPSTPPTPRTPPKTPKTASNTGHFPLDLLLSR